METNTRIAENLYRRERSGKTTFRVAKVVDGKRKWFTFDNEESARDFLGAPPDSREVSDREKLRAKLGPYIGILNYNGEPRYQVRLRNLPEPIREWFHDPDSAIAFRDRCLAIHGRPDRVGRLVKTVQQYWDIYSMTHAENYAPSTWDAKESLWANHILPRLGRKRLDYLTRADAVSLRDQMKETHASSTVKKVVLELGKVLESAREAGLVQQNVTHGVSLPKVEYAKRRALTRAELAALLAELDGENLLFTEFLVVTGTRIGEAAGQRVRDLDLDNLFTRIEESLVETRKRHNKGKGQQQGGLKTAAAYRRVPLTSALAAKLAAHVQGRDTDDFVFKGPRGGRLLPSTFRSRKFNPAVRRAGLDPAITPHWLRHTAATNLLANADVSGFTIARVMGHKNSKFTESRYGHQPETGFDEIRDAMWDE